MDQPSKSRSPQNIPAEKPAAPPSDLAVDEFFTQLQSDMRRPDLSQEAISAAFNAIQKLALDSGSEEAGQVSGRNSRSSRFLRLPFLQRSEPRGKPLLWNLRRSPAAAIGQKNWPEARHLRTLYKPPARTIITTIIIITISRRPMAFRRLQPLQIFVPQSAPRFLGMRSNPAPLLVRLLSAAPRPVFAG